MAQRFKKIFPNGFKPTYHEDRLLEPWEKKKPSRIFVCSIADLFAPWSEAEWRVAVLKSAWLCPVKHTFIFLTKNPERIPGIGYPDNFWMGTTVTNEDGDSRNIAHIRNICSGKRFVSFEPLLGALPEDVSLEGVDWIIIGKLTGSKKVKLDPDWVDEIVCHAKELGIPIFMKNNLKPDYPGELIQEFPDQEEN